MKKLEFETSKGKFILFDVDSIPSVKKTHPLWITDFNKSLILYLSGEKVKTICRLSDIIEEQASEIVQMTWISDNINLCEFKNYDTNGNGSLSSSIESLHSLIESKGVHLFENPYGNSTDLNSSFFSMQEDFNKEKEAEEKTFYNPYLFKVI